MSPLTALQMWIILVLSFLIGVTLIADHPGLFNGPQPDTAAPPAAMPATGWGG